MVPELPDQRGGRQCLSLVGGVAGPATGLPLFLVGTALYVCQTAFEPAVAVFFFDAFDEDEAGRAWGIDGMASKGAGVVAPTAGSLLYAQGPAAPFVAGAVLLVAATAVAATIPRY